MAVKENKTVSLKDKLSRLTYKQVCRLLGSNADKLLARGGQFDINIQDHVVLTNTQFQLRLPDALAAIRLSDTGKQRLLFECDKCGDPVCVHTGAAFSLLLEEKIALGLSMERPQKKPIGAMTDEEVVAMAMADRKLRAEQENMEIQSSDNSRIWTNYLVTNRSTGRSYRVALRGWKPGESYCSCPDFRKNTLGTCKHIIRVEQEAAKQFPAEVRDKPYQRNGFAVHLRYGENLELRFLAPDGLAGQEADIAGQLEKDLSADVHRLLRCVQQLEAMGHSVNIYPDAEEYMETALFKEHINRIILEIRKDPASHTLRKTLLNVELLPYQMDGIAFAAGAGRAILADDMGLGKTIQGIGVAELLAREGVVSKALVICPASLKSQWCNEIKQFCQRSVSVVLGTAAERAAMYNSDTFFTVCNYEQVLRDISSIELVKWDLVILDEGQRIKNWEAKTTQTIKSLASTFALVLTGTPLENRLDDLFSIVEFIDDRRLGPAFRFFNRHRIVSEKGRIEGYRDLSDLREKLKPVMLRRTRASVMQELPPRTTEIVRIEPTEEQCELDWNYKKRISRIVRKPYLTEMDLLRLQKYLLAARMAADSTFLVDKQPPGFSSKLEQMDMLLGRIAAEEARKTIIFSEWTTMLNLIEPLLEKHELRYVRLDGSVPQKQRQGLIREFSDNADCRVFLASNAGSTGLNLQAADTIINVDLPWNPALLEQRIGRAHRMGQKNNVHVFVLVTAGTIEENMLGTLSAKQTLFTAAMDMESDMERVTLESGVEELKRRLELLLGTSPDMPIDQSQRERVKQEIAGGDRRERIAAAGGELFNAAFTLLSEMIPEVKETEETRKMSEQFKNGLLSCMEQDDQGRPRITITMPDAAAIEKLSKTLSRLFASS